MAVFSSPSSLEEESEAPLCNAALTVKNKELQSDMKRVTSVFEKLQNYINLLALPSRLTNNTFDPFYKILVFYLLRIAGIKKQVMCVICLFHSRFRL